MTIQFLLLVFTASSTVLPFIQHENSVPNAPQNVQVKTAATTATLWWDSPPDPAILVRGYTVEYGEGSISQRILIEGSHATSFTVNRLRPNTNYVFAVSAYNEADGEDGAKVMLAAKTLSSTGSPTETLWPPINVHATVDEHGVAHVAWQDPNPDQAFENTIDSTQRHYVVQYGVYEGDTHQKVRSNSNTVKLTGLVPGKEYEVAVKVIAGDGSESPWSIRDLLLVPQENNAKKFEWRCVLNNTEMCGMAASPHWQLCPAKHHHIREAGACTWHQKTSGEPTASLTTPFISMPDAYLLCLSVKFAALHSHRGQLKIELSGEKEVNRELIWQSLVTDLKAHVVNQLRLPIRAQLRPFKVWLMLSYEREMPRIIVHDIDVASGACPSRTIGWLTTVGMF